MIDADELTEIVARHLPRRDPDVPRTVLGAGRDDLESGRAWLAFAAGHGIVNAAWPVEHGGRGADEADLATIATVVREFDVPDLYPYAVGLSLVAPIIIDSGTDAQRARWLPMIADGAEIWCQMFSEPGAGSDLANVASKAERDGDEWVVSGQKVWTSRGPYSKWGMCLARTDPDQGKHKGLTMFAVDMEAPGVEVRALYQMNGDTHFSEVFTDEVRVGADDVIGGENNGWGMAMTVLTHERAGLGGSGGGLDPSGGLSWIERLRAVGAFDDPIRRDVAMRIYAEQRTASWTAARMAQTVGVGGDPGSGGSGGKLRLVRVFKERTNLMKDALGAAGMLDGEGHVEFLTGPSMSIRGGTDEVQRNIIGERVLGLPPEPRVDKGVSYAELRRQGLT